MEEKYFIISLVVFRIICIKRIRPEMQRQIFHPCKLSGGFWGHFTSIYKILEWDIPYNCMKISCMFVPNFILDIGNRSSNIEQSLGFQGYGESFDGYFYILLNIPSHFSHCYYRSWAGSDCQHFPDEASHNEMRRLRARPLTLMCCNRPPEGGGHCYF